jgi:hypothetical protein
VCVTERQLIKTIPRASVELWFIKIKDNFFVGQENRIRKKMLKSFKLDYQNRKSIGRSEQNYAILRKENIRLREIKLNNEI